MGIVLRQGSSGAIFEGAEDGDTLVWNAATGEWDAGSGGAGIAPGSYDGQPVKWDGAAYVPLTLGSLLSFNGFGFGGEDDFTGVVVDAATVVIGSKVDSSLISLDSSGPNGALYLLSSAQSTVQAGNGGTVLLQVSTGARIALTVEHVFTISEGAEDVEVMRFANVGGGPGIGVFGVEPVVQPSITGVTAQEQIDSIVEALSALGWASDNR